MKNILSFPKNDSTSITIKNAKLIVSEKTKFQKVDIWETEQFGKIVFLNGWLQSIEQDEHIYHEFLVHPAFNLSNSNCKNVLIIGGGEGALLREILKYKSVEKISMIDIDEEFINICKIQLPTFHQGAFDNPKVNLIFEDGRKFLETTKQRFDVIILDLTAPDKDCPSLYLYTTEWYKLLHNCLEDNGVLSAYSLSANMGESYPFACIVKTIQQHFFSVLPLMIETVVDGEKIGLVIASKNELHALPFDIECSMLIKCFKFEMNEYIDNITLYRSSLLPKYITKHFNSIDTKIITDSSPIYISATK